MDFSDISAKLTDGLPPVDQVSLLAKKRLPVLLKEGIELPRSDSPHLFHCLLPFRAKIESSGALVQRGNQPSDDVIDLRLGKHARTGLHQEIFVEEKHLGADARIFRGWIIGSGKLTERLGRWTTEGRAKQRHNATAQSQILFMREKCHGFGYSTTTAVPFALTINMLLLVPMVS